MPENQIKNELSNAKKIVEEMNKLKSSALQSSVMPKSVTDGIFQKDTLLQSVSKSSLILPTKPTINFGISDVMKKSFEIPYVNLTKPYVESINLSALKTSLNEFSKTINSIFRPSEMISGIISTISTALSTFVKDIQIPGYSEEEKQKLIESYSNWGKYGWTPFSSMPYDLFDTCPLEQKEADKLALSYCDKNDLKECFEDLNKLCRNKKDLNEAILCYESRCYKACSMLLFSLIESYFIKKQIVIKRKNNEHIVVGFTAIKEYINKKQNSKDKIYLIDILIMENLFNCLSIFFENTKNFTIETKIANRNYIDHGFSSYRVRKKDCIKLFFLLKNLLEFEI